MKIHNEEFEIIDTQFMNIYNNEILDYKTNHIKRNILTPLEEDLKTLRKKIKYVNEDFNTEKTDINNKKKCRETEIKEDYNKKVETITIHNSRKDSKNKKIPKPPRTKNDTQIKELNALLKSKKDKYEKEKKELESLINNHKVNIDNYKKELKECKEKYSIIDNTNDIKETLLKNISSVKNYERIINKFLDTRFISKEIKDNQEMNDCINVDETNKTFSLKSNDLCTLFYYNEFIYSNYYDKLDIYLKSCFTPNYKYYYLITDIYQSILDNKNIIESLDNIEESQKNQTNRRQIKQKSTKSTPNQ